MKISKIKSKLDKILGITIKENKTEKTLTVINTLLEKLDYKESKLKKRLQDETDTTSMNKLEQKLKLIKRQIEKANAYKNELNDHIV